MMAEQQAPRPAETATREAQPTLRTIDPRCAEKIEEHRYEVLALIREQRPRFVPTFEQMTLQGNTIRLSVPSQELHDEIQRNRTLLLTGIARTANVEGSIELEVTINEELRAARPIKLEDRVRYITEKNPLLGDLRKALDMEVE